METETRSRRRPRWEASKDSDLYVDDVLAASPKRHTTIETAGPCIVIVLPLDGDPFIEFSKMTEREMRAFGAHRENDIRMDILLDAWSDVEALG